MIHYVVTAEHRYTIDKLLDAYAGRMPVELQVRPYQEVFESREFRTGTYVFTDLDRLSQSQLEHTARIWNALARAGDAVRLLNHPIRVKQRYELLRTLYERGTNCFDAYRMTEARRPRRYPVFVRVEDDHRGSQTDLLRNRGQLEAAVDEMAGEGRCRDRLIATEFHGAPDDRAMYRKYGAMCIAGTVIPRQLLFSRHWVVKGTKVEIDDDLRAKEHEYLSTNPHAELLREVFRVARIDYGRVDYAVVGGRVQIYEINTNPNVYAGSERRQKEWYPDLVPASDRLLAALGAIEAERKAARRGSSAAGDDPVADLV